MENVPQKPDQANEGPEQYGRSSLEGRYQGLSDRQKQYFDSALNNAGTDIETLNTWIADPNILEDEKVAACMRELALAISEVKLEFSNDTYNTEKLAGLTRKIKEIVRTYFA